MAGIPGFSALNGDMPHPQEILGLDDKAMRQLYRGNPMALFQLLPEGHLQRVIVEALIFIVCLTVLVTSFACCVKFLVSAGINIYDESCMTLPMVGKPLRSVDAPKGCDEVCASCTEVGAFQASHTAAVKRRS
eukprot:TRINITY_DN103789_c0_g1_i1.p2 TRINITY_DN103789_c0_g1~~TRINITY_DN103789_c0_g1_i1.p2  ORF type:complete len:133 (+),score=17.97 TRINITY_DN103789_c0_g1_i1:72-470(+)